MNLGECVAGLRIWAKGHIGGWKTDTVGEWEGRREAPCTFYLQGSVHSKGYPLYHPCLGVILKLVSWQREKVYGELCQQFSSEDCSEIKLILCSYYLVAQTQILGLVPYLDNYGISCLELAHTVSLLSWQKSPCLPSEEKQEYLSFLTS